MADKLDSRLPYFALLVVCLQSLHQLILIRYSDSHPVVIGSYEQTFATLFLFHFCLSASNELRALSSLKISEMALTGFLLGLHFAFSFPP